MFGISGIELFVILVVAFLIFGPEEMPRIGRIIGQAMRMFSDARKEIEDVITTEMLRPEDAEMLKDPLGMKSMKAELESTVKSLGDPNYKPTPKGAGMRVGTDDVVERPVVVAEPAELPRDIDPTDAASIWGVAPTEESADDTGDVEQSEEISEEVSDAC